MDTLLFWGVGVACFWMGLKTYYDETKPCKVFSKYPIGVTDVKGYNRFCAKLIVGFGIAAMLTMIITSMIPGIIGSIAILIMIPEGLLLMKIYRDGEKKYTRKR